MKKKVVGLLLCLSMVGTTMLAGCGGSEDKEPAADDTAKEDTAAKEDTDSEGGETASDLPNYDGVELTYWSMWTNVEPQGIVLQEAADAFEEQTGAKVTIEWKNRDIKNILSSALQAEEKIDLFEDDYSRICNNYSDYVADLTDMAEAAGYSDQSYAVFNNQAIEWIDEQTPDVEGDGWLPCVTEQPQVGGVFYNKDIFEDCGLEVPTTWDEFLDACKTMKDKGYQPLALDSTYADFLFGYHLSRYLGEDAIAEMANKGGWAANDKVAKAAQDMIDFIDAGYLADGAPDEYPASQNKIGLTEKVAMIVCANYVTAEVNKNTSTELNWGLFNYPTVEGGADSSAYAGANSIAITKYSENQQAAFDFATFLTSGEYDQKMADEANSIPADPANTAPQSQNGTSEVLKATEAPLSWNMGLNKNGDLQATIKEKIIQLFEGKYATGEDFAADLDSLY